MSDYLHICISPAAEAHRYVQPGVAVNVECLDLLRVIKSGRDEIVSAPGHACYERLGASAFMEIAKASLTAATVQHACI